MFRTAYLRILAAMTFFTRLPLWRLCDIPREYYERVVPLWPMVGWVTGGVMACVFAAAYHGLGLPFAVVMALAARLLLTGALHEDGYADFCDGFGGGTTRQRTLEIMKDSHIGTYGVIGLIMYYAMMFMAMCKLITSASSLSDIGDVATAMLVIVSIDTAAKYISSTIVYFLPYARKAEEAKNKLIYTRVPWHEKMMSLALGVAPAALLPASLMLPLAVAACVGIVIATYLYRMMHRRIAGYTGDCCGATFIIIELVMYIMMTVCI